MAEYIMSGKPDVSGLPRISVGKIFYNKFKQIDKDRIFLVDGETGEKLTYSEILKQSVKLADALKRLGLKQNDVISNICENNMNNFTAYLSALYYGFIFSPLNPGNTKYELCQYLGQTKPKCVFCTKTNLSKIIDLKADCEYIEIIVVMDAPAGDHYYSMNQLIKEQAENPDFRPIDIDPTEQIALILYSSGTTGVPKAVALSHKNIRFTIMQGGPKYLGTTDTEVQLFYLPCFHVISTWVMAFGYYGVKTVLLRGFQPQLFLSTIEKYKCNFALFVPLITNFFCESPLVDEYDLSSLKRFLCGSAPTSEAKMKTLLKRIPGALLFNLYGLTESSCGITICSFKKSNLDNIGYITSNCEAKYVNVDTGKAVGPNTLGELYIRGDCVLKEYYNNEKATQEATDRDGFFQTGDIGYFDEQKRLHIIDRIKDMIKYKGYQVSPVELENVLKLHKSVKDAAVIGIPDQRAGEVPIGFVMKNSAVSEEELLDFVADHLSEYKQLYGGIRFVEEIPRNALKKIDRKALRESWLEMQENATNGLKLQ